MICLDTLDVERPTAGGGGGGRGRGGGGGGQEWMVVLECLHCFHKKCLERGMEQQSVGGGTSLL
eukprot:COSAG03_NODE_2683_length_2528_cov_1.685467_4_plen_64_part_00